MNTSEMVRDSQALLEQMSAEPEAVLEALDPAERSRVLKELRVLAEQTSEVEAEADLLYVADEVHRFVEETPALATLLLPSDMRVTAAQERPKTRKITADLDEKLYRKSRYAQEQAVQIRNRVVECRARLERALRDRSQKQR